MIILIKCMKGLILAKFGHLHSKNAIYVLFKHYEWYQLNQLNDFDKWLQITENSV